MLFSLTCFCSKKINLFYSIPCDYGMILKCVIIRHILQSVHAWPNQPEPKPILLEVSSIENNEANLLGIYGLTNIETGIFWSQFCCLMVCISSLRLKCKRSAL